MKADPKLFVTIPLSTEYAVVEPGEVSPPAAKKRAIEQPEQPQIVLIGEAGTEKGATSTGEEDPKTPRLPSIKHLHLDIGSSWPQVEQYFNTSTGNSPQQSPSSTPASSAPPSPFPSSPATSGTPTTREVAMALQTGSVRSSPSSTPSASPSPLVSSSVKSHSPSSQSSFAHTHAPAMASMMSSYHLPISPSSFSPSLLMQHQQPTQEVLVPVVTNNFGFIETTFANAPVKKTHRRRPANVDKGSLYCHNCGAKNTPEWRRGPKGPATLCNACGLAYAKRLRQEEDTQQLQPQQPQQLTQPVVPQQQQLQQLQPQQLTLTTVPTSYTCACAQAAVYGRCIHTHPPQQLQQLQQQQVHPPQPQQVVPQQTTTHHHQQSSRPMQMIKGMPVRINSHTFHNYTPPTPHPSLQRAL